ncbi:MAG: TauD/TfdA family dioxygenase [Methylococcales bacterium]|nr:TauD/TfdA family dioxygenase [Methylococcales bacterium]
MIENIKSELARYGYVFIPELKPNCCTEFIANEIGSIFKVSSFVGYEHIPDIQVLTPREESKSNIKNKYSDNFGLNDFPLHTDLAHWLCPPRYILLRCLNGSDLVSTKIISYDFLVNLLGVKTFKKSVVKTRNGCVLPIVFDKAGITGMRWDSLFLIPMNPSSNEISNLIKSEIIEKNSHHIFLRNKGDTVIIDNWMTIHGRSSVMESEKGRLIERAYLSTIG